MSVFRIESKMKDHLNTIIFTNIEAAIEDLLERAHIALAPKTLAPMQSSETNVAQAARPNAETPDETREIISAAVAAAAQPVTSLNELGNEDKHAQPARPTMATAAASTNKSPSPHPRGAKAHKTPNGTHAKPILNEGVKSIAAAAASFDVPASRVVARSPQRRSSGQKPFDMSGMRSAIDAASGPVHSDLPSARCSTPSRGVTSPKAGSGNEYQQAVGSGGEYFVYKMLKKEFDIGHESWTSQLRSQFDDIPSFTGDDSEYADFTIDNPAVIKKIADWLVTLGCQEADLSRSPDVTYHIEVKTGAKDEPFSMSLNQVRLARGWHESPSDICVILRVSNLYGYGSQEIDVYLDPYGLMEAGSLTFTPSAYTVETN